MFEEKTFENLMKEKLLKFPSSIDTREGSLAYDATAGNSLETAQMYLELEDFKKESYGHTASRENLIRRAEERGIKPKPAGYGIYKGAFNINIPLGSRFSLDKYNYVAIKKIEENVFEMRCETIGTEPNGNLGTLIPIENIQGLTKAELIKMLVPGEDEEETESIRKRYLDSFETQAYGGNIKDYEEKTLSIAGVGSVKVTPVWKGGGTVELTILNSDFDIPSSELIEKVQEIIDPSQDGSGKGLAPIGHVVTVDKPQKIPIYIATELTLKNMEIQNVENAMNRILKEYLLELRKKWKEADKHIVRISQIESRLLNLNENMLDIKKTKINGYEENLELGKYEVPTWGGANYETS